MREREDEVECSMASLSKESLPDTASSLSTGRTERIILIMHCVHLVYMTITAMLC